MSGCADCGRGFHYLCATGCPKCHPRLSELLAEGAPVALGEPDSELEPDYVKLDKEYKDRKSTGRKRAAMLYPLDREKPCEWMGLKNCGGGIEPVIGCMDGKQLHRHHGPIKDPIHNEIGNVHRICTMCHNHWHELNDWQYDEEKFTTLVHMPELAEVKELMDNAGGKWKTGKTLSSSLNKLDKES